ncbi:hypothetical protein HDV00_002094 [Rhizophlyctis rosea]|nr:hypothetical protein HDV00_002094 [Rhizophlyctis rosea]
MPITEFVYTRVTEAVWKWPIANAFKQTSLTWKLTLTDATERRTLNSYWNIYGPRRMALLSSILCINCILYLISQFLEIPSSARTWRMGSVSVNIAITLATSLFSFNRRCLEYWRGLTVFVLAAVVYSAVVAVDLIQALPNGYRVGPPMEDVLSHCVLAAAVYVKELHPVYPIFIGTSAVLVRAVVGAVVYGGGTVDWPAVFTMVIGLGATALPAQLSIIMNRIYDVWIVHACKVHGIELKLLDVRAQYSAEFGRMYKDVGGSISSLRSFAPERLTWRQRFRSTLNLWDDPVMERRHQQLNYAVSFPIVVTYLSLYLIKHVVVSLINTNLSQFSTYAIGILIAVTIVLLVLNHLTRAFHNPILYPTYALLCMSYAVIICFIFLNEADPYLAQCCSPATATAPLSVRAAARGKAFAFICPVTGQMLNVATLFRLPWLCQFVFVALIPRIVWQYKQTGSMFWAWNYAISLLFAVGVGWSVEIEQRREIRLVMALSDHEAEAEMRKSVEEGGEAGSTLRRDVVPVRPRAVKSVQLDEPGDGEDVEMDDFRTCRFGEGEQAESNDLTLAPSDAPTVHSHKH